MRYSKTIPELKTKQRNSNKNKLLRKLETKRISSPDGIVPKFKKKIQWRKIEFFTLKTRHKRRSSY